MRPEIPFYFGPGNALFGLYQPPSTATEKAVLLCPPFGQEHIRTHRLYRQLARTLASESCGVLRFDYYGSGDSAGLSTDLDWNRCVANAVAAAAELRSRSGCAQVIAFGARFGGSVAIAAAHPARFGELILWDPILDGAAQVTQLDALHHDLRADPNRFSKPRTEAHAADQWLGFAISAQWRAQLEALRLDLPPIPTLLLSSADAPPYTASQPHVTALELPTATPWDDLQYLEIAILSHELIQAASHRVRGIRP